MNKKLQASIMPYAMFIMVIVTIILGSVLLLSKFNRIDRNRFMIEDKLRKNAESGIKLMMADTSILFYNESKSISLYGESFDSVYLQKKLWGFFDQLYSRSRWGNIIQERIVLADAYYKTNTTPALYLKDNNKPLCVSGRTYIKGDCILPKAGIKNGYVEGRHYERLKLLEGEVAFSDGKLPLFTEKIEHNYYDKAVEHYLQTPNTINLNIEEVENDTLTNSFYDPTICIYIRENHLLNKVLLGNIVVIAEKELIISKKCVFEDILIYAKSVLIESGFESQFQCFANHSSISGRNCKFKYPSNLALLSGQMARENKILKLGLNNTIEGAIVCNIAWRDKQYRPKMEIAKDCEIHGQIHSNGTLEIHGNVYGTIYCNEFILRKPSAIYINHLLDVEINPSMLDENLVGVDLSRERNTMKIVKKLI